MAHVDLEPLHRFHSYCARFPSEIVETALEKYTKPGERVLDPFCGSGTTLVACLAHGRPAVGADIDVLAGLLSAVKCEPRPSERYAAWRERFASRLNDDFAEIARSWVRGARRRLQRFTLDRVLSAYLAWLDRCIGCLGELHRLYEAAGVWRSRELPARVVCPHDAGTPIPGVPAGSQSLVVTSPPYFNAVDYPRAHRLSVCWMNGHSPPDLVSRRSYIGLRHAGPLDPDAWLQERPRVRRLIPASARQDEILIRKLCAFYADLETVLARTWDASKQARWDRRSRILAPFGRPCLGRATKSALDTRVQSGKLGLVLADRKCFERSSRPISPLRQSGRG